MGGLNLELVSQGIAPFDLEYTITWASGSTKKHVEVQQTGKGHINVDVPTSLRETGGVFSVTFTNLKDGNRCTLPLTTNNNAGFEVKVTRVSPLEGLCRIDTD